MDPLVKVFPLLELQDTIIKNSDFYVRVYGFKDGPANINS